MNVALGYFSWMVALLESYDTLLFLFEKFAIFFWKRLTLLAYKETKWKPGLGNSTLEDFLICYIIFHSIVQTNMKWKCVSWLSSSTYYKAIYPLVVLRVMPVCYRIKRKRVHNMEDFSASRTTYDNLFIYTEKEYIHSRDDHGAVFCFILPSHST